MLLKLLKSELGVIFFSILLGIGLALLFQKACKDRSCIVISAPSRKIMQKSTFQKDGKCYKAKEVKTKCTDNSIPEKVYQN